VRLPRDSLAQPITTTKATAPPVEATNVVDVVEETLVDTSREITAIPHKMAPILLTTYTPSSPRELTEATIEELTEEVTKMEITSLTPNGEATEVATVVEATTSVEAVEVMDGNPPALLRKNSTLIRKSLNLTQTR
jgi:hypothetical protein